MGVLRSCLAQSAGPGGLHGAVGSPIIESSTTQADPGYLWAGLGVALVPYYAVASRIQAGVVSLLRVESLPIRMDWFVIWHADEASPPAEAFKEHLLNTWAGLASVTLSPDSQTNDSSGGGVRGVMPEPITY